MLFFLIQKKEVLNRIDLFSENSLNELGMQLETNTQRIMFLVIHRIKFIAMFFLLSTTSLGSFYVYANVLWFGVSSGFLLTMVMIRYGLKGILLLTAGMFPHYLIYVPAVILTMQLSKEKRMWNGRFLIQFLVITLVVVIGCFLEGYINPNIVAKILKKF
jgi:stage II sporulation protein M